MLKFKMLNNEVFYNDGVLDIKYVGEVQDIPDSNTGNPDGYFFLIGKSCLPGETRRLEFRWMEREAVVDMREKFIDFIERSVKEKGDRCKASEKRVLDGDDLRSVLLSKTGEPPATETVYPLAAINITCPDVNRENKKTKEKS